MKLDPLKQHEHAARALTNLGFCLDKLESHSEALEAYTQAIELDPDSESTYTGLACVCMDLKRYRESLDAAERAALINPDNPNTHYNIGNARLRLTDLPGATAAYRRAIKLNPELFGAWLNLGAACEAAGDMTGAVAAFEVLPSGQADVCEGLAESRAAAWPQRPPQGIRGRVPRSRWHWNRGNGRLYILLGLAQRCLNLDGMALESFKAAIASRQAC